jgi:prephenate dehydratase
VTTGRDIKAAFQGERGAFSEEAARRILGREVQVMPRHSFDEMFQAVVSGAADCALAPIENTLAGSVIRNYDLLLENDLTIVGEVVLRVVHNLIAPPGVAMADVRRVYSHPVALAQCERFFGAHPQFEVVPAYDTAGSVKMIMESGKRDEAAIAGASAAEAYGAQILLAGIESNAQNFTRFFLLVPPDRASELGSPAARAQDQASSSASAPARRPCTARWPPSPARHRHCPRSSPPPSGGPPLGVRFYLDFMATAPPPGAAADWPTRGWAVGGGTLSRRIYRSYSWAVGIAPSPQGPVPRRRTGLAVVNKRRMLSIDLQGKRALVAGVADDGGLGFAIAHALAEAGASICLGTWPPALGIFRTMLERGSSTNHSSCRTGASWSSSASTRWTPSSTPPPRCRPRCARTSATASWATSASRGWPTACAPTSVTGRWTSSCTAWATPPR